MLHRVADRAKLEFDLCEQIKLLGGE